MEKTKIVSVAFIYIYVKGHFDDRMINMCEEKTYVA